MALMGDKALMFSASGRAFLMYGKRGRSWIALYDPIGPREEWRELVERFVRLAAEHGGRANFYQTRPDSLPFYLDLGFAATKLGEEAILDLDGLHAEGRRLFRAALCAEARRARRARLRDAHAPKPMIARLDELALISAGWLESRRAEEKGFSVAAFEPDFLARQRVALRHRAGPPGGVRLRRWSPAAKRRSGCCVTASRKARSRWISDHAACARACAIRAVVALQPGGRAACRRRARAARDALGPAGGAALASWQPVLQFPGTARLQEQVQSGLGAALLRVIRRDRPVHVAGGRGGA